MGLPSQGGKTFGISLEDINSLLSEILIYLCTFNQSFMDMAPGIYLLWSDHVIIVYMLSLFMTALIHSIVHLASDYGSIPNL